MSIWLLNLRHLAALAAIVRLGSISAAARAVALTQPAVTQALAKLEAALGLRLFDRRPDGMVATPAARLLAPRIEAALVHIGSRRVTMAQVRALIAVADGGSYAGASALSGLAPPSLHRAVGDLGLALGRSLVERRGRGLMLTSAGRRTARGFRLARAELLAGLGEVAGLAGPAVGRIAIGAMPLSRARLLPQAVAAFHRLYPEVAIAIAEGSHVELIEPLRDGEIDMMIGALRHPSPGPDVVQVALMHDRPVVLARAGHPLAETAPDLAAIASYPWIVSAPGTPLRGQWEAMFDAAGMARPPVPIESGSVMIIRGLLRGGDFLTLLSPDQVASELVAGWLVQIAEMPPGLRRTIGVTTRADWTPTAPQRAFLALLKAAAETSIRQNL
ncbi:LysR family transcriptional regulator [alpha proteobacterium AAP81b]|nr:LysR family transcriptional regulator [alpha proteobacterium AAP81b]